MNVNGTAAADLVEGLRAILAEVSEGKLKARDIDPSANLFDYGYVDSLSGVMFLARIEETWGVQIEDFDLVKRLNTIQAVAEFVSANR
ncbi:MAG: acyl carrier protein [Myxococcota bacterium]